MAKISNVICAPLSARKATSKLWTSDVLYVNCYQCKCDKKKCIGTCIYTVLGDTERNLCPQKCHGKGVKSCADI